MKVAVIYNYESSAVINLFGFPNRERYGLQTIKGITAALKAGGHQVKSFEGDKNIVRRLENFMPAVISGERPGLVFNLSYGIQGRARYTHIPGILEMLGIPYLGSSPDTHALALDKVVTKMILAQRGLPTPRFDVLDGPDAPLGESMRFPLIVKPKNEAVSYGLRIVHDVDELREGVTNIVESYGQPALVEEYVEGREINVGLLGNSPVEALPPVELDFGEGEAIYTFEDKVHRSSREIGKICPAPLSGEQTLHVRDLAKKAFNALNCLDFARVDFRMDREGGFHILEVNSMASLGHGGSYVHAAAEAGMDFAALVNRMVDEASRRYFGTAIADQVEESRTEKEKAVFTYSTRNRDSMEKALQCWTDLASRTGDVVRLSSAVRKLDVQMGKLGLSAVDDLTNDRSAWTWQTKAGLEQGTLVVFTLDSPIEQGRFPIPFRREPEWLHGEAIASSRAGIVCALNALGALRSVRRLKSTRLGLFAYTDEGRGMRYSARILRRAAERAGEVIVMSPGAREGKVITQRRGLRKYSFVVEGDPMRIGARGGRTDVLNWFLGKAGSISALSQPARKLTVTVQEVRTERYSVLMPHRIPATIGLTFLDPKHADEAEAELREIVKPDQKHLQVRLEVLEERPPLRRRPDNPIVKRLGVLSEGWKLPFGVDSSLLPSAAGCVPVNTPVVCGLGPPGRDIYTPSEAVHRGELLQRSLLLALFLGRFQ